MVSSQTSSPPGDCGLKVLVWSVMFTCLPHVAAMDGEASAAVRYPSAVVLPARPALRG
jgi:hypothetical protein